MNQPRTCPQCGAELARDTLEGMCPNCVARLTFGVERESPELPDADLALEHAGAIIGRYKLLEQIGEGGFGVVYMAEQVEPVQRKVAIKIVKAGMDTRAVVARFEAERQALALMDHPNIAKVYDGGTTGSPASQPSTLNDQLSLGRSYFVMELVRGIPITEFCDQKKLSTTERLTLFMSVCSAVQHAHQKGIIHRDLKPSNILVTLHDGKPVPKVIDFGVAKALGQKLTEKTLFTAFAQLVGTPAYMSPEQAELSGLDVDTRSDIYSLGVLLYELLTGVTPFDRETLAKAALDEVRHMIREVVPTRPSTRLTQERLRLEALGKSLIRHPPSAIHKDLDWIVMKCLEKDRARRYDTANGLAMDVGRHLKDEAIVARPPSRLYGFQKAVRRHKLGFAAAALLIMVLAAGVMVSTWQAVRATRAERAARTEAERSEQVSQFLKDMLKAAGPSVARGRDATLLRAVLDKTARRVQTDLEDQPEVRGDLWFTLGTTYLDIGDHELAIAMFQGAVVSYQLALGEQSTKLALSLGKLGRSQSFCENVSLGASNAMRGLEIARKCGDQRVLASALLDMGCSLRQHGDTSIKGAPFLREAVTLRRQLGDDSFALAESLHRLADSLNDAGDPEAEPLAREALAIHRRILEPDHPDVAWTVFVLGQVLIEQQKWDKAETVMREALRLYSEVHDKAHPYQPHVIRYLARVLLSNPQQDEEGLLEAEALLCRGIEYPLAQTEVADYLELLYECLDRHGRATDIHRLLTEKLGVDAMQCEHWKYLGNLEARRGRWSSALDAFSSALELAPSDPDSRFSLAILCLRAGRLQDYGRLSRKYIADAEDGGDFDLAGRAAILSMLLPIGGPEFERGGELANFAASNSNPTGYEERRLARMLTDYRRAHYPSAIAIADEIIATAKDSWLYCEATAWFVKALACSARHEDEAAELAFVQGERLIGRTHDAFTHAGDWTWPGWQIAVHLRNEAATVLEGQATKEEPDD